MVPELPENGDQFHGFRKVSTMSTRKAALVGVLGAAALSLGMQGTAGAATATEQAAANVASAGASLSCTKSVGNTGGWVECKGRGTWRVKSICDNERDKYTTWHSQRGGKQRVYAEQCTFDIDDVRWEVK